MKKNSDNKKTAKIQEPELKYDCERDALIAALSKEYDEVLRVNFDTGKEVSYRSHNQFERPDDSAEENLDYQKRVDKFANSYVVPEDRFFYVASMNEKQIKKEVEKNGSFSFKYRVRINDEILWFESRVIDKDALLNHNELVLVTRNVDEAVKKEEHRLALLKMHEMREIIDALSEEYSLVVYVDPATEEASIYRWNESILGKSDAVMQIRSFSRLAGLIADSLVYTPDKEAFIEATRKNIVMEALNTSGSYKHNFRIKGIGGRIENWQMRFIYTDSNKGKAICAFRNIDAELETEIKKRKEIERQVIDSTEQLKEKIVTLNKISDGTLELLGEIVEYRNVESGEHVKRVKQYTFILADMVRMALPEYKLTKEDVELIVMAAALHDIGKIAIPDSILLKPGKLTNEEFEIMKQHSVKGAELIKRMEGCWSDRYVKVASDICLCHHEKWDGRGYPKGLKGDEIPISAQIVTVADCYDALTTERVYKRAYTPEVAFEMIIRGECGKLSEKILSCLQLCRVQFENLARNGLEAVEIPELEARIYEGADNKISNLAGNVFTAQERKNAVIAGIARDYDYVCHINTTLKHVTPYHISERFKNEYGGIWADGDFLSEKLDQFFNIFVFPEDMPSFMVPLEIKSAAAYLKMKGVLVHRFRGLVNGQVRYFDIKLVADASDSSHIIMCIQDVDALVREKRRHIETRSKYTRLAMERKQDLKGNISDIFLNNYLGAYYICLEDRSLIIYKQNPLITDRYGEPSDYREFLNVYVENEVAKEDRELVYKTVSEEFMREYLKERDSFNLIFREIAADGFRWVQLNIIRGLDDDHVALCFSDVDDYVNKQKAFEEMETRMMKDDLTGAGSIMAYREITTTIDRVIKSGIVPNTALVFCDINNLKDMNDTYGHAAGDEHIKKCFNAMQSVCENSKIFRIGGDEFIILLEGKDFDNRDILVQKLKEIEFIASGMAVYDPLKDVSIEDTQKRADEAMYADKRLKEEDNGRQ